MPSWVVPSIVGLVGILVGFVASVLVGLRCTAGQQAVEAGAGLQLPTAGYRGMMGCRCALRPRSLTARYMAIVGHAKNVCSYDGSCIKVPGRQ